MAQKKGLMVLGIGTVLVTGLLLLLRKVEVTPSVVLPSYIPTTPETFEPWYEAQKAKQLVELGITEAELPSYQDLALKINEELGGRYVNGVLTPPSWWTESVTAWSRYVQAITAERWQAAGY